MSTRAVVFKKIQHNRINKDTENFMFLTNSPVTETLTLTHQTTLPSDANVPTAILVS